MQFFELRKPANFFPALNGLRVFGIVLIIVFHVSELLQWAEDYNPPSLAFFASLSTHYSIDLFFILSGFLIGTILIQNQGELISISKFPGFYARRALRILPLYYFVLAMIVWISPEKRDHLLREIFYLTNYPGSFSNDYYMSWSWSLSVEEHFYLAVPFIIFVLQLIPKNSWRSAALGIAWASGAFVRYEIFTNHKVWTAADFFAKFYTPTHARYDIFFAGIFLAYIQKFYQNEITNCFRRYRALRELSWLGPAVILLGISWANISVIHFERREFLAYQTWSCITIGTLPSLAFGTIMLYLLNCESRLRSFFSRPIFHSLGTLGYAAYLVHLQLVIVFFHMVRFSFLKTMNSMDVIYLFAIYGASIFMAFFVAYGLHILVEKPGLVLRDRFFPA